MNTLKNWVNYGGMSLGSHASFGPLPYPVTACSFSSMPCKISQVTRAYTELKAFPVTDTDAPDLGMCA